MKKYRYEVVIRCTGQFEMDDEEAAAYDEDELNDYAAEVAIELPDKREVEDVEVTVV